MLELHKLLVPFAEVDDELMFEHHSSLDAALDRPLVLKADTDEVYQLHRRHLLLVNLALLDADELVIDVLLHLEVDSFLKHEFYHLMVIGSDQSQDVGPRDGKVRVEYHGFFELGLSREFGYLPSIVDEVPSVLELRVHDERQEVQSNHLGETSLDGLLLHTDWLLNLGGIHKMEDGIEKRLVPISHSEEDHSSPVLHLDKQLASLLDVDLGI